MLKRRDNMLVDKLKDSATLKYKNDILFDDDFVNAVLDTIAEICSITTITESDIVELDSYIFKKYRSLGNNIISFEMLEYVDSFYQIYIDNPSKNNLFEILHQLRQLLIKCFERVELAKVTGDDLEVIFTDLLFWREVKINTR